MIITKDTTLKELYEYQEHCMIQHEKTKALRCWTCFECEYFQAELPCKLIDFCGLIPKDWILPRVDFN